MIKNITVVGSGYMGGGIAQSFALGGFKVQIVDKDIELASRSHGRLLKEAQEFEDQGLFLPGSYEIIKNNLSVGESFEEAVGIADFIEEAVFEVLEVKRQVLSDISKYASPTAIIGTNTSTIPVKELFSAVENPERFLTVHFSNPAPFIPGVELVAGEYTSKESISRVKDILKQAGKESAEVADAPGMVLNRLQYALFKEATAVVEQGVASIEAVDMIVKSTFGFRLGFFGPFAIADQAGLDVYENCFKTFEDAYGERMSIPELLKDASANGRKGVKNGRGLIQQYSDEQRETLVSYRNKAYAKFSQLLNELGRAPEGERY